MDPGFISLTIVSGSDIKRGSLFGPDKKIAVAWVDPKQKRCTKSSEGEASNPEWNDKLTLPLGNAGRSLTIEIRSKGAFGDTLLGTVHIPVADIAMDGTKEAKKKLTYLVERPSGKRHGSLNLFATIVNSRGSAAHPPATSPVIVSHPEEFCCHSPWQTNAAPAPYLAEQSQTVQPYPPAESFYPPPYPSSQPVPNTIYPPVESYLTEQSQTARPYYPAESFYPLYPSSQPAPGIIYPPIESYLAEQSQTARPYPPAESVYPPPYPSSQPAPDAMKPTHPAYGPVSSRPLYWSPSEYSCPPPLYDCYPPSSPPAALEYSVTAYPPTAPPENPVAAYPPTAPYYLPVQYPQYHSYAPRYPSVCGHYPYPHSYDN